MDNQEINRIAEILQLKINHDLKPINTKLDSIATTINNIQTKLEHIDARVGNLEVKVEDINTSVDLISEKQENLHDDLGEFYGEVKSRHATFEKRVSKIESAT